ncbi:unnamed protein product [Vitrella brassicaformis CCMP3155]|uniref:Protein kinase domain-containing protein n=1 Tax=Vitrella brassicaformis (strain CCMP3155) TaxID=1169540 RepID=A0A0G4ELR4_VITBC|nr:unnamed protein product [Vitrella brassicaformis CCMP3155]|eukprot:CEL97912.1 unnamed protein product [Vitrella brassicaformis CCMP3155]
MRLIRNTLLRLDPSPAQYRQLVKTALASLRRIHEAGLVHGDSNGGNVLVVWEGGGAVLEGRFGVSWLDFEMVHTIAEAEEPIPLPSSVHHIDPPPPPPPHYDPAAALRVTNTLIDTIAAATSSSSSSDTPPAIPHPPPLSSSTTAPLAARPMYIRQRFFRQDPYESLYDENFAVPAREGADAMRTVLRGEASMRADLVAECSAMVTKEVAKERYDWLQGCVERRLAWEAERGAEKDDEAMADINMALTLIREGMAPNEGERNSLDKLLRTCRATYGAMGGGESGGYATEQVTAEGLDEVSARVSKFLQGAERQARQAEADQRLEEMLRVEDDVDEADLEDDMVPDTDWRPPCILRYEAEEAARRQKEEDHPNRIWRPHEKKRCLVCGVRAHDQVGGLRDGAHHRRGRRAHPPAVLHRPHRPAAAPPPHYDPAAALRVVATMVDAVAKDSSAAPTTTAQQHHHGPFSRSADVYSVCSVAAVVLLGPSMDADGGRRNLQLYHDGRHFFRESSCEPLYDAHFAGPAREGADFMWAALRREPAVREQLVTDCSRVVTMEAAPERYVWLLGCVEKRLE